MYQAEEGRKQKKNQQGYKETSMEDWVKPDWVWQGEPIKHYGKPDGQRDSEATPKIATKDGLYWQTQMSLLDKNALSLIMEEWT